MSQAALKTQEKEAAKNKAAEVEAKKVEEEAKQKREQEVWPHSGVCECASLGSVGGGCILRRPLVRAGWAHPLLPRLHP